MQLSSIVIRAMQSSQAIAGLTAEFKEYGIDIEDMEAWIAALRSGNYPQGRGHLCIDGEYCPLGVYAKISGYLEQESLGVAQFLHLLPGFPQGHVLASQDVGVIITALNDGGLTKNDSPADFSFTGYDFPTIADIIEKAVANVTG